MFIKALSGSQFPNAYAILWVVYVMVGALLGKSRWRWLYTIPTALLCAAVGGKNLAYWLIISQPHAQHDSSALHAYGHAVIWVAVAQLAVCVCVLASSIFGGTSFWPAVAVSFACAYAAVCMLGWASIYLTHSPRQPVTYQPSLLMLVFLWTVFTAAVVTFVIAVVTMARRFPTIRRAAG